MRSIRSMLCVAVFAPSVAACGAVPPLPNETELPVGEIITAAVCQFRDALYTVQRAKLANSNTPAFTGFDPRNWAVSLTLTPKNTLWLGAGLAGSYKSNPAAIKDTESFVASLAGILNVPTANVESVGYSQSVLTYTLNTAIFFDDGFAAKLEPICKGPPKTDMRCVDRRSRKTSPYDVSHDLMICEWLFRALSPVEGGIMAIAAPNANSFSYTVSISVNAGAGISASYVVPNVTWVVGASAGGRQQKDVSLAFGLTQDSPKPVKAIAKPSTTAKRGGKTAPAQKSLMVPLNDDVRSISSGALQRLDNIQGFSVPGVNDRLPAR